MVPALLPDFTSVSQLRAQPVNERSIPARWHRGGSRGHDRGPWDT